MAQPRNHSVALFLLFFCLCLSYQTTRAQTWEDAFEFLGISWNPNGTLNRTIQIPMVNATPSVDTNETAPIAFSQDVTINPFTKAYVRLYIPSNLTTTNQKLPVIIYLHGGDFVLYSASTVIFHDFCNDISAQFPALVISVEYLLAPEHRLPAAYIDALNAILWTRDQAMGTFFGRHPWLDKYADFSRVYLLGSSAGANIVFQTALRVLDFNIFPLQIKGLLLNQGFFGGVQRTASEIRLINDSYIPLYVTDVLWTLALPIGANRDHYFCNPLSGGPYSGRISRLPRVYVKSDNGDPLVDRSTMLVELLRSYGVSVVYQYGQGGYHGMELSNSTAAQILYDGMKSFINSVGDSKDESSHFASI